MRDIKFRVWLKEIKTMQYSDKLSSFFKDYEGTNIQMMQYTGMEDKNGVEIYEDDNLRIDLDGTQYISPVMKKHGCWVIYHPYRLDMHTCEKDYINFGWWTSHDNVEVVGNIHELESHT